MLVELGKKSMMDLDKIFWRVGNKTVIMYCASTEERGNV